MASAGTCCSLDLRDATRPMLAPVCEDASAGYRWSPPCHLPLPLCCGDRQVHARGFPAFIAAFTQNLASSGFTFHVGYLSRSCCIVRPPMRNAIRSLVIFWNVIDLHNQGGGPVAAQGLCALG